MEKEGAENPSLLVPYDEVHAVSLALIEDFEAEDATVGLAVAAMVMTLGRLMSPDVLEPEQEEVFIKDTIDYLGAYFAGKEQ